MASGKPHPCTVVLDPDASLVDIGLGIKSKEELKAIYNVADKLRQLGAQLQPPHMKPLRGEPDYLELRPRQGRSASRPIYRRFGDVYVILAVAKNKADFAQKLKFAKARSKQYG
jgi:hypothetical protein